jgi:ABC-type phosphate transport system substrate-binding protein
MLAVNGVLPTHDSIANGSYPFTAAVYGVIRKDLAPRQRGRILLDWLLSEDGQKAIEATGYVRAPVGTPSGAPVGAPSLAPANQASSEPSDSAK